MKSTRQSVLETSADMFNRYGIEAVSFGQIAEELKKSPGNLTYHFNKKSDLIATHIAQFEQDLQESVEHLPAIADPKVFSSAYLKLLELTLQYRFLFIGANYIIQNDLVSVSRYDELIETTKNRLIGQVRRLAAADMIELLKAPYSIEMLVDSIWWQWLGWLLAMQIRSPMKQVWDRKVLAEGALHILFLCHHYIEEDFFLAVQAEIKKNTKAPRQGKTKKQKAARKSA